MPYVRHRRRDSAPVIAPLLLALGSLGLLAIIWRRRAAPRVEQRRTRADEHAQHGSTSSHTSESATGPALDPDIARVDGADAQPASTGTGALVHRRYDITLSASSLQPTDLLRLMQRHLTELAPSALADFTKSAGSELSFRAGDEYEITMLGPWNGCVRVADVTETAFTLVTLDGHPEAGHITFSAARQPGTDDVVIVSIESWARARDAIVSVAYSAMNIGKQVQAEVWITFLQRLAALAGATETPQVHITTEELANSTSPAAPDHEQDHDER